MTMFERLCNLIVWKVKVKYLVPIRWYNRWAWPLAELKAGGRVEQRTGGQHQDKTEHESFHFHPVILGFQVAHVCRKSFQFSPPRHH